MGDNIVVLITSVLTVLIVAGVPLLIARELVCWYWKINEGLKLLQSIDASLKWQNARLASHDQQAAQQRGQQAAPSWPSQPSP